MNFKIFIISLFVIIKVISGEEENANTIITTPMGKIEGSIPFQTRLGRDIFSFRGIRYAKAPIDDLRFQPPVAVQKYEGIYNATADGPTCPQPPFLAPSSEDCLFLNVYTTKLPRKNKNPKRPVIIHLHSGGFYSGTERSNWGGPQYFMDRDIVLITMNYRLGSLGFMSTGDRFAPGNNGLKDQVVAMKWVQKNIEAFGGDPKSVTLMGYSAGSWSVLLHMVSPMSKGLFHKGIASSGSYLGIYPLPKAQLQYAQKQAQILKCPDDTSENIIKCLKTKTAEELGNSLFQFFEFGNNPILLWSPVIEGDFGQERFLPDQPLNLIKDGKVMDIPLITGVTKDEFHGQAIDIINNGTLLDDLDKNWEKLAPICFSYERNTDKSKLVSKKAREFYVPEKKLSNLSLKGLSEIFADGVVGYSVNRITKLLSETIKSPVYHYRFSYQGRYSHINIPGTDTPAGVAHHDDLIYTFYISTIFPYFNTTDPEFKVSTKLTTLFENFAKTGNPTPMNHHLLNHVKWEPYKRNTQKYLDLGERFELKEKLYEKRYNFWESLYPIDKI
ncbi:unnamed protein product [Brassicogethes aeneus]|uniref:Carboxylic ester hydrolase n=1 Tax=Brassicogethes aeneus TaxID=1431903 RepID=A0A9P0BKE1_BRAAE|nr:unnamed protein product [Brassicogethes aeneus]